MDTDDVGSIFVDSAFKFYVHHRRSKHRKDLFLDSDKLVNIYAAYFDLSALHVIVSFVFVHEVNAYDVVAKLINNYGVNQYQ